MLSERALKLVEESIINDGKCARCGKKIREGEISTACLGVRFCVPCASRWDNATIEMSAVEVFAEKYRAVAAKKMANDALNKARTRYERAEKGWPKHGSCHTCIYWDGNLYELRRSCKMVTDDDTTASDIMIVVDYGDGATIECGGGFGCVHHKTASSINELNK